MSHFSEQVWADFVRGIGPTDQGREIEAHLMSGCPACDAADGGAGDGATPAEEQGGHDG